MLLKDQHPLNKSISIALVGPPNVGKSTLINTLLGMDLSIVSPRPQTTRNQFQCVTLVDRTEIIFLDTPGLHKSMQEMNLRMNHETYMAQDGADLNWIVLDGTKGKESVLHQLASLRDVYKNLSQESWIVVTKLDQLKTNAKKVEAEFPNLMLEAQKICPVVKRAYFVSALEEAGTNELLSVVSEFAPSGNHLYPDGSVSNKNVRFFVAEYIREQVFTLLQEELPYEIAVTIEEFVDLEPSEGTSDIVARISAVIHVNRMGQRAIVIGQGGLMIREIGMKARQKIETLMGGKVMLKLHAKVSPKWFKNHMMLEELGLSRAPNSIRAWREDT
ncbi:MAG: GTPase Era [Bacteriovoracaceae bacterium]|nr:GTPase Era [Bacteriovoracaceae bacterium]